jgi:hypothetical protein
MQVSEQRAWQLVSAEFDRLNHKRTEKAADVQRLEIARLDAMLAGIWDKARGGNVAAIDRVLGIMQRRAKLLGLDLADKQPAATGNVTLHVTEVIVNKREELANVHARDNGAAAPGPASLPEK